MARQAGIPLVALFETTDQVAQALPAAITGFLNRFIAIEVTNRTSPGAVIHTGKLQSLDVALVGEDIEDIDLGFAKLRLPGITTGIPFRLAKARGATIGDLEPGASSWQFDLFLDDFALVFDQLTGARPVKESGTTPRHLEPLPGRPPVAITGAAGLRIEKIDPDAPVTVRLMDVVSGADPFLPNAATGGVARVTCTPPHFIVGTSGFGFTIKDLLFDGSRETSPPFVIERGQSADWVGFGLREATFYTPSAATGSAGFSATLRDFLIGSPLGLQGELEVQFGRSPLNPATFVFHQNDDPSPLTFDASAGTLEITAQGDDGVQVTASLTVPAPPAGNAEGISDYEARFEFPRRPPETGDTASGSVRHGDELTITPIEVLGTGADRRRREMPSFTIRMVASGTSPIIKLASAASELQNVVDLAGQVAQINGQQLAISNVAAGATYRWKCADLSIEHEGNTLTLALPSNARGTQMLVVEEKDADDKSPTRVQLRLREQAGGALLVGCKDGVFDAAAPATALQVSEVLATYDLHDFHTRGELRASGSVSTASGSTVTVPPGALAEVSINEGGAAAIVHEDRHIQLLFPFDNNIPNAWGTQHPHSLDSDLRRGLLTWAKNYNGSQFVIIGRCDDVGTDAYNAVLGQKRADTVRDWLAGPYLDFEAVPASRLHAYQEQAIPPLSPSPVPDPADLAAIDPPGDANSGRLINTRPEPATWPQDSAGNGIRTRPPDSDRERFRELYRRVDVYALGGTVSGTSSRTESALIDPTQRKVLVPADGRDVAPADNDNARMDYRVKLLAGWDRARISGPQDIVPNLAEIEFAWSPSATDGISLTGGVMTVYGKWIYDDLTGFTEFTAGLTSQGDDKGLADTDQKNLVVALSLGPMLLSGVDFDDDVFGSTARLAALAGVTAFATLQVDGTKTLVGDGSNWVLRGLESKSSTRTIEDPFESFKTQFTVDYTTKLHVNTGAIGLKTKEPMKLRYDKVGVAFDNSDPSLPFIEKIGFAYESDSMTIEDSGLWEISGPLKDLLRVSEFRMGVGSFWVEPTIAVALDLGVVEISEATFRVTFNTDASGNVQLPPDFSLRGLTAKVDIPAALKGEGRVKIEDGGIIKAGVDVTVIPLQVRAVAALAMGRPPEVAPSVFLNLYAKIQFPGGIPLGPLPLAIHGFIGQTVINGERDKADTTDIVTREIGWWRKNPEEKYKPKRDQHALGVGVVLGTLPDASFSLSATGMVVVAFPDPEVILGVEVNILSIPDTTAKDKKEGDTASITGLVVIDDEAVSIAVSATYEIPQVLKLKVPFAGYFPYPGTGKDVYVRIGADGAHGRAGEPITIQILPSTINLKAWAFLMIEGGGIVGLGGEEGWDFEGFAVGFGAGVGIEWKAGPIGLSASARILAGFGTDPLLLKGGLFVDGKLDLVVVSISARGNIVITYLKPHEGPEQINLKGEFCGEVDLFFFSISGCVDFNWFDTVNIDAEPPPPPVASITLTDRLGATTGEATAGTPAAAALFDFVEVDGQTVNQGVPAKDNNTVWPDTVPVINFRHFITDAMPATAQFDPASQPAGDPWFGSSRLKYAYRLLNVTLRRKGGAVVADPSGAPLQSAWTHPPARPANDTSGGGSADPSGAEVTHLQLLNWEPWAWARGTANGGEGQPGDPADTVGRICDPATQPRRSCLLGSSALQLELTRARLTRPTPPPGPYPSRFRGETESFVPRPSGDATGAGLAALVAGMGMGMRGGEVWNVGPVAVDGVIHSRAYRLPAATQVSAQGEQATALPWRINLDRDVTDGELVLLMCRQAKPRDDCYAFEDAPRATTANMFDLAPFRIAAIDARKPLQTTDRVDVSRMGSPQPGSDGAIDMTVLNPGATITLKRPCRELHLHYLRPGTGAVIFRLRHADGSTSEVTADAPASVPMVTKLEAKTGIVTIEILLRAKMIYLYKLCCMKPVDRVPPVTRHCIDLGRLSDRIEGQTRFTQDGVTYSTLSANDELKRTNQVDAGQDPAQRGQDGSFELVIPDRGLAIDLATECARLEIGVMLGAGQVKLRGLASDGTVLAEADAAPVQHVGQAILLVSDKPMARVEIEGGDHEALLYSLCCLSPATDAGPAGRCIDFGRLAQSIAGQDRAIVDGASLTALGGGGILLVDKVALDGEPRADSDGALELLLDPQGTRVQLPWKCKRIEVHLMQLGEHRVTAIGADARGRILARELSANAPYKPQVVVLESREPMSVVTLTDGHGKSVLYRVCCAEGIAQSGAKRCVRFRPQPGRGRAAAKLVHEGITFLDAANKATLRITDGLKIDGQRISAGRDGVHELAFGAGGLEMLLQQAVDDIELVFASRAGAEYKIRAFDESGREVAGKGGRSQAMVSTVKLAGKAISRLLLELQGKGVMAQLCYTLPRSPAPVPTDAGTGFGDVTTGAGAGPVVRSASGSLAFVTGEDRDADGAPTAWPGEVLQEFSGRDGRQCLIVRYRMPGGSGPFDRVTVTPRDAQGLDISMLSLCGVDQKAANYSASDAAVTSDLEEAILHFGVLDYTRPVVLDPDTEYEIEVAWEWKAWVSESDTDNAPATPSGTFNPGIPQVFHFRTAPETPALPALQDGPNEHIFDPRDVDRYLEASNPENAAIAHFTDDPVVFHFSQNHVANLLQRYGREFDIEVRRTDPPPQPGGDFSGLVLPLAGVLQLLRSPPSMQTYFDQRINAAVAELPCIESDGPLGGASLAGVFDLLPRVMYDADLMARKIADHDDKIRVHASRFMTSRYANPREMVEALGMDTTGGTEPTPLKELVLDASAFMPTDVRPASDREFDQAMAALGLDTLELPVDEPRAFQLWRPNAAGPGLVTIGLLLDAVEPLDRTAAVIEGGKVEIRNRCSVIDARIDGAVFQPVRRTRNATRILLAAPAGFIAPVNPASFQLRVASSSGDLIGRRYVRSVPLAVQLEGF